MAKTDNSRVYNILYHDRLIYVRATSSQQVKEYFKEKENVRLKNNDIILILKD